ncbi:MAG: AbrB/MazE/SpoVT family DNA-binding domain-containing protein [Rhodospirillales bacterium]|nr:AbrB/MazE/SpoVT family DNA-binding domain-containing protein [Rhodospirillales bacterium]
MSVSIVSAKGWVVIPKDIRERYGFKKGTRVKFVEYGGVISIAPVAEDRLRPSMPFTGCCPVGRR